ncbi:MAG: DNA polymerase I [Solobacterium sp.]|nr:DNA polymerase I [Solobacterium sp.]
MKKLLLVDGNAMLFRAYYATAYGTKMTSSQGLPTNAVFGFANMLQKAMDLVQPDSILVAFDAGKHTFRHELYAEYKGGRKPAPDDLVPQFQMVRDYLDAYHIRWVERKDIEADDLIGSYSKQSEGWQTIIFSSDRDLLQLIDEDTTVMLMKKGITEMAEMNEEALKEEMGIRPLQIIDLKGLMGDHSDNIPGIPGIGEKTALKLLYEYDSVENVLAHGEELKGALGKKVREGKESALLSKTLATIRTDVELEFGAEECEFHPDYSSLVKFFESLDMRMLAGRYKELAADSQTEVEVQEPAQIMERVTALPESMKGRDLSIYFDADKEVFYLAELRGVVVYDGTRAVYLELNDALKDEVLKAELSSKEHLRIGFDIKKNMHFSARHELPVNYSDDVMIMANLCDSTLTSSEKILEKYGLSTSRSYEEIYGTPGRPRLADPNESMVYACERAIQIRTLYDLLINDLQEEQLSKLYREMELPLTSILFDMEETGVICDRTVLESVASDMKKQVDELQAQIYDQAGHEFNINSPKQLAVVLYDELGLPSGKKRSTGADVLEKLKEDHPIIGSLLSYRKLQKIYSTYAEGLQKYIRPDGRIHTLYNQCATQTGRLSSSDPNLQNISVRDEQGRIIRRAFLPEPGHVLLSSDYHQIELRMLASMAEEDSMIDAFNHDIDIHTKTAMDVFGVEQEDVTKEMRRRAKTVNFGIVYGISDFGLGEQLGISRREANEFIETYYARFPKIRTYMDSLVQFCEEHGYVLTICGRRRSIPEIKDKNRMVREFGKRAAMNAPIQGSAADLIKIAMIHIDQMMKEAGVKSQMILQVHDELIFDVPQEEVEQMKQLVIEGMVKAMSLKVPLTVECSIGNDWYEAK